jgi:demethylmenaquinone methyltransferase/2-methoxy-6-polyprenyl-1,4-benzoquinol methylase
VALAAPSPMPDPSQVRSMFARIAGSYDLLNRVLSLGIDRRWRQAAVRQAGEVEGRVVVDACSGTGDLALAFRDAGARVVGVDFTREMLVHAVTKDRGGEVAFAQGDALRLPVADGSADVASVAFGIRNVADRKRGLEELMRVVRPGGRVLVLEFTTPPGVVLGALYRFYFTRVLPIVGRLVSGDDGAYTYLPRTVLAWPSPTELEREMAEVGLVACGHRLLTRGIACLHWGTIPGATRLEERRG